MHAHADGRTNLIYRPGMRMVLAVLIVAACTKDGGAGARRSAATRMEDETRRSGRAATVFTRGDGASVLVMKDSEMCGPDLWDAMVHVMADPPLASGSGASEFNLVKLGSLGFKRFECENGQGAVVGIDLPYVPPKKTDADVKAEKRNQRERGMKALEKTLREKGQTVRISVSGDDGSTVELAAPDCSDDYLSTWQATMSPQREGFTMLKCIGPDDVWHSLTLAGGDGWK